MKKTYNSLEELFKDKKKCNRPLTYGEIMNSLDNMSEMAAYKQLCKLQKVGVIRKVRFECVGYKYITKKDLNQMISRIFD